MKYAVVQLQGKQYKVSEGENLTVDHLEVPDNKLSLTEILLLVDGENVKIGTPHVEGAEVLVSLVSHQKAEKIRVATYKAKSRFRKVKGHRQHQTTLLVEKIKAK